MNKPEMFKSDSSCCPDDETCDSIEEYEQEYLGQEWVFNDWFKHAEWFHCQIAKHYFGK